MKKNGYRLGFYYFQVYGYLYVCAFFDLMMMLIFISGGFMDIDLYIPRMNMINYIMAAFHLFKAVMYIVIAIWMRGFRQNSEKMLIWIKIANLLLGTFYVLVRLRHTFDVDVYDVMAVLIITGIPLLINYLYFKKREELFCN
ncbi:MAG: hypothetical protein IJJ30_01670 [Erysipelotrichaceae bacterium]|nr:hypothetical protein [Erysipelotrichaceae bacterium]